MTRHVYSALNDAGADLSLRDAGYYALDALRIEAGRRAWGAELGPDETPFEAGLAYAVKLDKADDFIGRAALLAARQQPLRKKLLAFVLDDAAAWAWGGEAIVIDGRTAGELSSVGYSPRAGACVALGYVGGVAAQLVHAGRPVAFVLWGEPVAATAWVAWPPRLDTTLPR
jgi:4-methylaminobutanoate oxidase (formaldehyde-forming)